VLTIVMCIALIILVTEHYCFAGQLLGLLVL
jgi:hypothetical protein